MDITEYWIDPNMNRGGIIPIKKDNAGNTWLCFGILLYGGNLSVIGGQFDQEDNNLLDTIIREFNEEVGDINHPNGDKSLINITSPLTIDDLTGCHAIKSSNSVLLFAPDVLTVKQIIPTNELSGVVWLTIDQFSKLYKNHIGYKGYYTLSGDLAKTMGQEIINYVTNNNNKIFEKTVNLYNDITSITKKYELPTLKLVKTSSELTNGPYVVYKDGLNYYASDIYYNYYPFVGYPAFRNYVLSLQHRAQHDVYAIEDNIDKKPDLPNSVKFIGERISHISNNNTLVSINLLLDAFANCQNIQCKLSYLHEIDNIIYDKYDKLIPTPGHKEKTKVLIRLASENLKNYNKFPSQFNNTYLNSIIKRKPKKKASKQINNPTNVQSPSRPTNVQSPSRPTNVQSPSRPTNVELPPMINNVELPTMINNVQQPSRLTNVQQPSRLTNVQSPSRLTNVQSPGRLTNVQSPGRLTNVQPNRVTNVQQPSRLTNVQQPSRLTNVQRSGEIASLQNYRKLPNKSPDIKTFRNTSDSQTYSKSYSKLGSPSWRSKETIQPTQKQQPVFNQPQLIPTYYQRPQLPIMPTNDDRIGPQQRLHYQYLQ